MLRDSRLCVQVWNKVSGADTRKIYNSGGAQKKKPPSAVCYQRIRVVTT